MKRLAWYQNSGQIMLYEFVKTTFPCYIIEMILIFSVYVSLLHHIYSIFLFSSANKYKNSKMMLFLVDLLYPNRRFHIQALAFQSRIEPEKRKKRKRNKGNNKAKQDKNIRAHIKIKDTQQSTNVPSPSIFFQMIGDGCPFFFFFSFFYHNTKECCLHCRSNPQTAFGRSPSKSHLQRYLVAFHW